jgi:hypothetical protein
MIAARMLLECVVGFGNLLFISVYLFVFCSRWQSHAAHITPPVGVRRKRPQHTPSPYLLHQPVTRDENDNNTVLQRQRFEHQLNVLDTINSSVRDQMHAQQRRWVAMLASNGSSGDHAMII